jgi:hypothetical protein
MCSVSSKAKLYTSSLYKCASNICKNTEIEDQHSGLLQNGSPYFMSEALEKKRGNVRNLFYQSVSILWKVLAIDKYIGALAGKDSKCSAKDHFPKTKK